LRYFSGFLSLAMLFFVSLHRSAALLVLAGLAACSSKNEDAAPANTMSWTIDGSAETAAGIQISSNNTAVKADGPTGSGSTAAVMSLIIPKKAGTYDLASGVSGATAVYVVGASGASTGYLARTGTITVNSLSNTSLEGTFSFTGTDLSGRNAPKAIGNGKFTVTF
jgi:hypothetical protein